METTDALPTPSFDIELMPLIVDDLDRLEASLGKGQISLEKILEEAKGLRDTLVSMFLPADDESFRRLANLIRQAEVQQERVRKAALPPEVQQCIDVLRNVLAKQLIGSREGQEQINQVLRNAYQVGVKRMGILVPKKRQSRSRSHALRAPSWGQIRSISGKPPLTEEQQEKVPDYIRELADLRAKVLSIAKRETRRKATVQVSAKASDRLPAKASDRLQAKGSDRFRRK